MKIKKRYLLIIIPIFAIAILSIFEMRIYRKKMRDDSFNWKIENNQTIKVYLNQHPYSDAIIKSIPEFEKLTGINVEYFVSHENVFMKKVLYLLKNRPSEIDVFMVGPHYIWKGVHEGIIMNLRNLIYNKKYTSPDYNYSDFQPNIVKSLRYNPEKFTNEPIWAIPLGFELFSTIYNKKYFDDNDLKLPNNFEELEKLLSQMRKINPEMKPFGIRGINAWTSLSGSYLNLYYNYGLTDFIIKNDKLIPNFNSEKSIEFNEKYLKIIKEYIGEDWKNISWYDLGANLGSGKYKIIFDADFNGYYQNISSISKSRGELAVANSMTFYNKNPITNIWTWALGINSLTNKKVASWLFVQYFTSKDFFEKSVKNWTYISPPRESVLNSKYFLDSTSKEYVNFLLTHLEKAQVLMTPQPYAMKILDLLMQTLLDIFDGKYKTVKDGLDKLNADVEKIIEEPSTGSE